MKVSMTESEVVSFRQQVRVFRCGRTSPCSIPSQLWSSSTGVLIHPPRRSGRRIR